MSLVQQVMIRGARVFEGLGASLSASEGCLLRQLHRDSCSNAEQTQDHILKGAEQQYCTTEKQMLHVLI